MIEIQNARIVSTHLGPEDHGIFTAAIEVDYGGSRQSFGGYDLRHSDAAGEFIQGVLRIAGKERWENLINATLRVKRENGFIIAIGDLLKDVWFTPKNDLYKTFVAK